MTSHDVVNRVRRLFSTKRVGHTGTLDPMATGVLALCVGQATRIAEYLTAERKTYVAGVTFGVSTDTEDTTGTELQERDASSLTEDAVRAVLPPFTGRILQTPPMVSAVHHEGKRLYELARQGIEVERQAREVEVLRLELTSFTPGERAEATIELDCSSGLYVRTLAADIGAALGFGAAMSSLRRTRVGGFTLDHCHSLDELAEKRDAAKHLESLLPLPAALAGWPQIRLDDDATAHIRHGQPVPLVVDGPLVLLLTPGGEPLAIARPQGDQLQPVKVFAEEVQ